MVTSNSAFGRTSNQDDLNDLFGDESGDISEFRRRFFGENPEAAYFGQQGRFGQGQNQRQFFQSQFNPIFNQYLGGLAGQLNQGNVSPQTFSDFAGGFDFDERFRSLAPSTVGRNTNRFAPSAKFLSF